MYIDGDSSLKAQYARNWLIEKARPGLMMLRPALIGLLGINILVDPFPAEQQIDPIELIGDTEVSEDEKTYLLDLAEALGQLLNDITDGSEESESLLREFDAIVMSLQRD